MPSIVEHGGNEAGSAGPGLRSALRRWNDRRRKRRKRWLEQKVTGREDFKDARKPRSGDLLPPG